MAYELLTMERRDDGVAVVTMQNGKVNPLSRELLAELRQAADELAADLPGAVVITGGDRIFAAGADISQFGGPDEAREIGPLFHDGIGAFAALPRFVIASVAGYALGGGCELALGCDYRIVSEKAVFGQPEILLGIIPGGGGTQRLARVVGASKAKEMCLTGRQVKADEALRIGLVNEVVPHAELMERAERMARHIVSLPPVAVRMMKEFIVRFGDMPTDSAWHVQALINSMLIQNTMDGEEGRAAFNEKRPPEFTGTLRQKGEPYPELSPEDKERLAAAFKAGEY